MQQTDAALKETFQRIAYNLNIIYQELVNIDYLFTADVKHEWQKPLTPPDPNVESLLAKLKHKVKNGGHIPLSLEYFYRTVGSCNFCWDWETNPNIPWEGADPIDIPPLSTLIEEMVDEDSYNNNIIISGDYLMKDNVSGSCYMIELTSTPCIDSEFLGSGMLFLDYLRLAINNCGFSMAGECDYEGLKAFCNAVRPKLADI